MNSEVLVEKLIFSLRLLALGLYPVDELTVLYWLLILLSSFILCWILIFIISCRVGSACWEERIGSCLLFMREVLCWTWGKTGCRPAVLWDWNAWVAYRFCWNFSNVNKGWATGIRVLMKFISIWFLLFVNLLVINLSRTLFINEKSNILNCLKRIYLVSNHIRI